MSISLLDNLDIKKRSPDVARQQHLTIADMVAFREDYLPDVYEAFCLEDGNKYRFRRTNDVDPTLGKWRVVTEGGMSDLPTASATIKGGVKIGEGLTMEGETLKADVQSDENFTTELKEKLEDIDMSTKVDVEEGKGLSTNDLTDELKAQYDKAEENVQSDWDESDETVDSFIKGKPTKLSDFDNDEEFITKAVDDLENYYKSSETYTQSEVNALVNAINSFELKKVDVLPTEDIDTHCIYFVPHGDTEGNLFDEFIYIDEKWENLGPAVLPTSGTASEVSYENTSHLEWDSVQKALDGIIAIVEYVDPKINTFTMTPSTTDYEIGQSVASLTFDWTYNKAITSQSLTDATLELADRTATIDGPFTTGKTFTLTCSDGKKTATASKSIAFKNKTYWGSAALQDTYDSDFVLGLANKQFATSYKGSFTQTVNSDEYGFFCCPKSFNCPSETYIGGFLTDLIKVTTFDFTNASGGVVSYDVFRTGKSGLGNITMEFK